MRHVSNQLSNTHKITMNSQCNDGHPGIVGYLNEVLKNDIILYILFCILNLRHCKLHFMYITLHMRVALKSQYLFVAGAKPFPANQNV